MGVWLGGTDYAYGQVDFRFSNLKFEF